MSITFLIARIAFVAIFLVSGVKKLMAITATAALIQGKFTIPATLGTSPGTSARMTQNFLSVPAPSSAFSLAAGFPLEGWEEKQGVRAAPD